MNVTPVAKARGAQFVKAILHHPRPHPQLPVLRAISHPYVI